MTALCGAASEGVGCTSGSDCAEKADAEGVLAQPHIPRYRNTANPLRAWAGSASPRAARRKVSYWDVRSDVGVE
jgi:hypothetical protein